MHFFDVIRFTDSLINTCREGSIDSQAVSIRGGAFVEWLVRNGDMRGAKYAVRALAPYFRTCNVLSNYQRMVVEILPSGEKDDFLLDMKDTIVAPSENIIRYV